MYPIREGGPLDNSKTDTTNLPSAIVTDNDGTLFSQQTMIEVFGALARHDRRLRPFVAELKVKLHGFKDGEVTWEECLTFFVQEFWEKGRYIGMKPSRVRDAARAVQSKRFQPYTRGLLLAAHDLGIPRFVISGSLQEILEVFLEPFDLTEIVGVKHPVDRKGRYTGAEWENPVFNKGGVLERLAAQHQFDPARAVVLGDTESDIPMLERAGFPIAVNPNPGLDAVARERGWTTVVRKKGTLFVLQGDKRQANATAGLPTALAEHLQARLTTPTNGVP